MVVVGREGQDRERVACGGVGWGTEKVQQGKKCQSR